MSATVAAAVPVAVPVVRVRGARSSERCNCGYEHEKCCMSHGFPFRWITHEYPPRTAQNAFFGVVTTLVRKNPALTA
jgi:hypothetical protein